MTPAMRRRLPDSAKPLVILIGVYVVVFFLLAHRRWAVFGNDTSDFGYFNNMFWHTVRGDFFYASATGGSNLAVHTAFLWALLIPAYWLIPGVPTLIFLQTLFLGICAWPVYLIARRVVQDHTAALILAAAFILLPPIVSQNVNQIEEPSFIAVFLLFAFYFYQMERFGPFMLFAGISCLGRENVPLAIAMFGVYALIQRRAWKWIVGPPAMAIPYFLLALYVILPHFQQGAQWHAMRMFKYLGNTPTAIVWTALTDPGRVLGHLTSQENLTYFVFLIQPLGWVLPFLSPASLMALPDLAINLLSDNTALKVINWHYNVITGCFIFVGTIYAVGRYAPRFGQNQVRSGATAILLLSIAHWFLWFFPHQYQRLPHHESLVRAMRAVPPDKSLIVPVRIQGHITSRAHYDQLNYFRQNPGYARQFEYVILDANERQYPPLITQEFFDSFYKNPEYRMVFAENNVFVFQRLGGESDWKIKPRVGGE
jgi:uncharacterized membrane protein